MEGIASISDQPHNLHPRRTELAPQNTALPNPNSIQGGEDVGAKVEEEEVETDDDDEDDDESEYYYEYDEYSDYLEGNFNHHTFLFKIILF